jgi:hypothetical protein
MLQDGLDAYVILFIENSILTKVKYNLFEPFFLSFKLYIGFLPILAFLPRK